MRERRNKAQKSCWSALSSGTSELLKIQLTKSGCSVRSRRGGAKSGAGRGGLTLGMPTSRPVLESR